MTAPLVSCSRLFARAVEYEYSRNPNSGNGALYRNGRYHVAGMGRVLYLAGSMRVLELECGLRLRKHRSDQRHRAFGPTTVVAVDVELHSSVLDLCNQAIRRLVGTTMVELTTSYLAANINGTHAATQRLGIAALRQKRIHALRVPSARAPGGLNLVIFVDRLDESESVSILTRPMRRI